MKSNNHLPGHCLLRGTPCKCERDLEHIPSGCAISGIFNRKGKRIDGNKIIKSIKLMHDRSNGLGGGFAAYGIYPKYKDYYAFHVMLDDEESKEQLECYVNSTSSSSTTRRYPREDRQHP